MPPRLVRRGERPPDEIPRTEIQRVRQMRPAPVAMPVSVATALHALQVEQRKLNRGKLGRVAQAWRQALLEVRPDDAAQWIEQTNVVAFNGGVLRVAADHPALVHELGITRRAALLAKLRELLAGKDTVVNLAVKPGRVSRTEREEDCDTEREV